MAWSRRGFGEPFSIPFDDTAVIVERDLEWFDGERLIIDTGEAATFTATDATGATAVYSEDSPIGIFDIAVGTQELFVAEGATCHYELWDAEADGRVRVKGQLRRLPAAPASEVSPSVSEIVTDETGDILTDHLGDVLEAA